MTSQLNVALPATWIIDVLGLFCDMLSMGVLYDQALANVWSTGAGIICLYCTSRKASHIQVTHIHICALDLIIFLQEIYKPFLV